MGALAISIDEAAHAKLPEAMRPLYLKQTDGKYKLDAEIEDTTGLKNSLEREREKSKAEERARKELEKRWEGMDPDEIRKMIDKLGGDEEAQLIKAGKIDEVVNRRTEKQRLAHEKALAAAVKEVEKAGGRAKKYESLVLDNHIRAAATKVGLHANAVEDALFRARTMFTLSEDGVPVQVKDGEVVMGKDAKTPFSPGEWLEGMKESAPHWFPSGGSGGGGAGSGKIPGAGKTMKRADFERLGAAEKTAVMKDKVALVD